MEKRSRQQSVVLKPSEWEATEKPKRNFSLDMTFSKFYEIYEADVRHRVKETT